MYKVFEIPRENVGKAKEILRDNTISRQSIAVRDATGLGIDKDLQYILIEGTEDALKRAEELFAEKDTGKLAEDGTEIYEKIKKEEETVAEGVGFIFGD